MNKKDKLWFVVGFVVSVAGMLGFMWSGNYLNFITIALGMFRCVISSLGTITKNIEYKRLVDSDPSHYSFGDKEK